jgi:signal transduction histidine kinase/ActR/RegA family two-component response regulator
LVLTRYGWFLILFCFSGILYAAPSLLILEDSTHHIQLMNWASIFEDRSGQLTFDDILSNSVTFTPASLTAKDRGKLNKGLTLSAFWIKIHIQNKSKKEIWYLTHWGGISRRIQLYQRPEITKNTFIKLNLTPARAIRYKIKIPYGATQELYLRIQDKHTPLTLQPELQNAPTIVMRTTADFVLNIFIIGGLFILSLYNFIYFIYLKDHGFLLLSVFVFFFLIEMGNHAGMFYYIWFIRDIIKNVGSFFAFSTIAFGISLFYVLTEVSKNLPQLKIIFFDLLWVTAGLAIVSPFLPFSAAFAAGWALFIIILISIYIVFFYRKGLRLPSSMIISIIIFTIGILTPLLKGITLTEDLASLSDFSFLGLLIALLFLSLTQAETVRLKRKEIDVVITSNKIKDEFLATMSHELRTPMNAVVSAGRLLQMTKLSDEQKEFVSRLGTSSQHMLSLINDILDLEKINHSKIFLFEKINFTLKSILDTLEQILNEKASNKHLILKFNNHFSPLNKQLKGDPTRLKQILLNLLDNAIKFTHQGSVKLSITPLQISEHHVSLLFEVSDTGIGISKKQQITLFDDFTQANSSISRQYGGSGLGLAISYKLVKHMGGKLQVNSSIGKETCFFFTLKFPLVSIDKSDQVAISSNKIKSVSLVNFRVLLVDDDEMNRYFGGKLLKTCGVQTDVAKNGQDALEKLKANHIDLVLMDVNMPEMDGYEATQHIRNDPSLSQLPVIALTAHAMTSIREKCLSSGMNDFITKPFELEALESIIRKWLIEKPSLKN